MQITFTLTWFDMMCTQRSVYLISDLSTILKLRGNHSCTRARGLNSDLKIAAVTVKARFDLDCLSPRDFKVQLETKTVINLYDREFIQRRSREILGPVKVSAVGWKNTEI